MANSEVRSVCPYCGVGCGVLIEHDGERILDVAGDPGHPANLGKLCSKGSTLHLTGDLGARALYPELRLGKGLARGRTDWDSALEHAASVFAETIREHGPDSVAFYVSGQLPLVDGALPMTGKVGGEVTEDQAFELARQCGINLIAALKHALKDYDGGLDRVTRIAKVGGFVASASDFTGQPRVINGASELLGEAFGDAGQHARSAVGVNVLPLDTPVEVDLIAHFA